MLTDRKLVEKLLKELQGFRHYLEVRKGSSLADLESDLDLRYGIEHVLQMAVQCCIDVGSHIVSDDGLREPHDYSDLFLSLAESQVISSSLLPKLRSMARFRNLLVHIYARVDLEQVQAILQNHLSDFDDFADEVARYIYR